MDLSNLGHALMARNKRDEARQCFERALSIDEAELGPDHPTVLDRVCDLGAVLAALGQLEEALRCFERVLRFDEATVGSDHANVLVDLTNLVDVLFKLGRDDEAKRIYLRIISMLSRSCWSEPSTRRLGFQRVCGTSNESMWKNQSKAIFEYLEIEEKKRIL